MPWNEGIKTFVAGADLEAKRRVKVETGTTNDPPEVVYADAGENFIGVTEYAVDDGDDVAVKMNSAPGTFEVECVIDSEIARGTTLYGADDGKVSDESSGTAQGISLEAAATDGDHIEVAFWNVMATTAALVSVDDTGGFTSEVTVEAALAEIYQHIQSAQKFLNLPMGAWTEQDGTALADFADGNFTTPGWSAGDEGFGIRWNNHANPDPISTSIPIPPDLDDSADVIVHVAAAKVGDTGGDATKFTIEAFFNNVGAAYDADADCGGDTSAMTGDATTKTVQEETLTIASANVTAHPGVLTLTLQPKDGTLGTDDVIVLAVWLEYTGTTLAS